MAFAWSCLLAVLMYALAAVRRQERFIAHLFRREPGLPEGYAFFAACIAALVMRQVLTQGPRTATLAWFAVAGMMVWIATVVRASAPTATIAAGALSNLLVVAANGFTMPSDVPIGNLAGYAPLTAASNLWFLGDVFQLHGFGGIGAYSIGDIVMNIGFWWLNARLWLSIGARRASA